MNITDADFDQLITKAMDELPEDHIKGLNNVVITFEDAPSAEQRTQLNLRGDTTLLGLFEGIPLTRRAASDSLLSSTTMRLPDKITLFKLPLISQSKDIKELAAQIKHTLWHEIAHYYGLDHARIHAIERGEI